jgi:hypothetical protein
MTMHFIYRKHDTMNKLAKSARWVLCPALLLAGYASAATMVSDGSIKVTDARVVSSCKYIDTLVSGMPQRASETDARASVLEHAGKRGATHVVWSFLPGGGSAQMAGKAYRCDTTRL